MTRPSTSLALALALLASACKEDAPAPSTPTPPASTPAGTPAGTPPSKPEGTPAKPTTPVAPLAAPTLTPSTAAALDPLLDLVATGADTYVVVRAPNEFIDGFASIVLGGKDVFSRVLDAMKDPSKSDTADAGMRKMFVEFDVMQTALASSGLHLERGMTITKTADGTVTILAADDAEAVPKLMRTLSAKPDDVEVTCKALPDVAGFVVCAEKAATAEAYKPGKGAAALRAALGAKLGDATLDASNVVATVSDNVGPVALAVRTSDGVLQFDFRPPGVEPFVALDSPGPAAALALVAPGGSFGWARLDALAMADQAKGAPPMVANMIRALSGEVLMASIGKTKGLVTLVGLADSTPIAGLIPMAGMFKDNIPKELPDGSKIQILIEDADDGKGGKLQVLRVIIDPVGELKTVRDQLGLAPEVTAFVTKQWGAIGMGTGTAIIPDVAGATASEPSAALLAALPPAFAYDLQQGKASVAMHLELDGLHAPGVREQLATAIGAAAPKDSKVTPADGLAAVFAFLAPLSSVSMWSSSATDGVVFHVALRGFGDGVTAEGKAAQQARFDVQAGRKDGAAAYGELVTAYASSPRIEAYRVRAGQLSADGAPGAVAVVGVLAAVAIPAFTKYVQRAKASAPMSPPVEVIPAK